MLGLCALPVTTLNAAPHDPRLSTSRSECGIDIDVERNHSLPIWIYQYGDG